MKPKFFNWIIISCVMLCMISIANAADQTYCVSSAGNATVNGNYTNQTGAYGGCTWYRQAGENNNLRLEGDNWTIMDGGFGLWEYYHPIDVNMDEGGECMINESWEWLIMIDGTAPAPLVQYGACGVSTTTTTTTTVTTTTTLAPTTTTTVTTTTLASTSTASGVLGTSFYLIVVFIVALASLASSLVGLWLLGYLADVLSGSMKKVKGGK